jgi:hypothetical protein
LGRREQRLRFTVVLKTHPSSEKHIQTYTEDKKKEESELLTPTKMHDPIADAKAQEATHQYTFRPATPADIPSLQQMIGSSLRSLGKGYYTQAELDGSIGYLFGPDSVLIHDQYVL